MEHVMNRVAQGPDFLGDTLTYASCVLEGDYESAEARLVSCEGKGQIEALIMAQELYFGCESDRWAAFEIFMTKHVSLAPSKLNSEGHRLVILVLNQVQGGLGRYRDDPTIVIKTICLLTEDSRAVSKTIDLTAARNSEHSKECKRDVMVSRAS